jgi:hypothetical protein
MNAIEAGFGLSGMNGGAKVILNESMFFIKQ